MRRLLRLAVLLPVLAAPGCEGGSPWAAGANPSEATRTEFGPTATFERRLLFLADDDPAAEPTAVFDFVTHSDSTGVQRDARVRVGDAGGWLPLVDTGWQMQPMREPWRLVPHGALRLVVNDAGDLSTLEYRGEPTVRLASGPALAEYSPEGGTQLQLRQAALGLGAEDLRGILLDVQLGRPEHALRPSVEALLRGDNGLVAVLVESASGPLVWQWQAPGEDVWESVRVEPAETMEYEAAGRQVTSAWQLVLADGQLVGELRATGRDLGLVVAPDGSQAVIGFSRVRGWVAVRGERRDVAGVLRHIEV